MIKIEQNAFAKQRKSVGRTLSKPVTPLRSRLLISDAFEKKLLQDAVRSKWIRAESPKHIKA